MDLVAKRGQFASPMVSTATGFHGNLGGGKLHEEGDDLRAAEIHPQHRSILLIDAVEGEDRFGRVNRNAFILGHGQLRFWLFTAQFGTRCRGAVHPVPSGDVWQPRA
jgi:hypothetical protein